MRAPLVVITAVVLSIGLAACQRQAAPPEPPASEAPGEMGEMQVVTIVAREFAFEPNEIRVRPGMVRFVVRNEGSVEHDFEIVGVAEHGMAHEQKLFRPGETYTVEVELAPGRYEVVCNVAGHRESGMTAAIIVE